MQVCYKCGTDEELSKKTKHLMICRPCRRETARNYRPTVKEWAPGEEWYWKAFETNKRIVEKYSKVSTC